MLHILHLAQKFTIGISHSYAGCGCTAVFGSMTITIDAKLFPKTACGLSNQFKSSLKAFSKGVI